MTARGVAAISFGLLLWLTAVPADAQSPYGVPAGPPTSPFARPIINPYLNLLRPGASPAFNYITLVQPQRYANNAIQQLGQGVANNQQAIATMSSDPGQLATGHHAGFMTSRKYFLTGGAGVGGQGIGTGAGARPQAGANRGAAPASGAQPPTTPGR